jgi:ribosomal protein L34
LTKHIFKMLIGLTAAYANVSYAQSVAECPVPQLNVIAVSGGSAQKVSDLEDHKYRNTDQLLFQIDGAFTGHYTVIYYSIQSGKLKRQVDTFSYTDANRSFLIPCGYEYSTSCETYALESSGGVRDYDDFTIMYSPCFTSESSEKALLVSRLPNGTTEEIPSCRSGYKARYDSKELRRVLEHRRSSGCDTIRDRKGNVGVVKRIPIGFR